MPLPDIARPNLEPVEFRLARSHRNALAKAKKLGTLFDEKILIPELRSVLERQGYRCAYCPRRIINKFILEHRRSMRLGGLHTLANIQFTCNSCNTRKRSDDTIPMLHWAPTDIDHTRRVELPTTHDPY